MTVRSLICCVLVISGYNATAQERPEADAIPAPSTRKASHFIGLQANQLIRQILSFGGNNTPVSNPYLLSYAVNSKASGFGFATGLGYSLIQSKNNDNFISTTSKVSDFAWRFGLEKKVYLSRHWLTGIGFDALIESSKSETKTKFDNNSPAPTVTTTTKRSGFGPRVLLNYQFSEKLMIGTEASFYAKFINVEQKTQNIQTPPDPNAKLKSTQFTLPAAIFVIVKI